MELEEVAHILLDCCMTALPLTTFVSNGSIHRQPVFQPHLRRDDVGWSMISKRGEISGLFSSRHVIGSGSEYYQHMYLLSVHVCIWMQRTYM